MAGPTQLTLVSHYGTKPVELERLIRACHEVLARGLGGGFEPYASEQVHATLIGLEGRREGDRIVNAQSRRRVDPGALLAFVRDEIPSLRVRIGGYRAEADYGFTSRGQHPAERSFSIQGRIAVAMGWPDDATSSLDRLRRKFDERLGVRHKYHTSADAVDNDFFFVLGTVTTPVPAEVGNEVRACLAQSPVVVIVGRSTLRIVAYQDPRLPRETSQAFALDAITPERLLALYPSTELE